MPFSTVHARAAAAGLLMVASITLPATSALSGTTLSQTYSADRICGAISPRLIAMGDDYYDLNQAPRNAQDTTYPQQLSSDELLAALRSESYGSGEGLRTECFGSSDALSPRSASVILEDIDSVTETSPYSDGDHKEAQTVVIQAYEYDKQRNRSRKQSLAVPLSAVAIETFSGLLISSHHRQRQATLQGSYLQETELTALQTESELILEQNVFVNGTLSHWNTWRLQTR